ncbi:MAG: hypothetical protein RLZZ416_228 [Candidatus Parcubacteria bacterium]|jgi:CubicO group peptidase (beta-lactamase class C family)
MHKKIAQIARRAIEEQVFPGCVIGIIRPGEEKTVHPFGRFTYESDSAEIRADTIYDMASVTKSIPLVSLALQMIEEKKLRLSDPIKQYVPELQHDHGATVEDLLRYRVRGPQLSKLRYSTFEAMRAYIFERGFDGPPGEGLYSNIPAYVLGAALERVSGKIIPDLADAYFFGPLGMRDTTFFPGDIKRCAPTEVFDGKEVRGIVHDESARVFARAHSAVGHAGLFSTAPDVLNFLSALLSGRFPAIFAGARKGLGWQVAQPWFMGVRCAKDTFGKTGFTGTSLIVDAGRSAGLVILSNRTYPKRPADAYSVDSAINRFRASIADSVLADIH